MLETDIDWVAVYEIDGKPVANGEPCATVFSSKEIIANQRACANPDDFIKELMNEFGAFITG